MLLFTFGDFYPHNLLFFALFLIATLHTKLTHQLHLVRNHTQQLDLQHRRVDVLNFHECPAEVGKHVFRDPSV